MANVVIIGVRGDSQLYAADLDAGTLSPLVGDLPQEAASLAALRQSGNGAFKGVDFAVSLSSATQVAASFHET